MRELREGVKDGSSEVVEGDTVGCEDPTCEDNST